MVQASGNDSPDAQLRQVRDDDVRIVGVLRGQPHSAMLKPESRYSHLPVDDHLNVSRIDGPIHDELVAVHGVTTP